MSTAYYDTTVIIPTLNEEGNIERIIDLITRSYKGISVVVADDGSEDKTQEIVRRISAGNRSVKLLDRSNKKEHGIAASVMDSSLMAKTPKLVVMDADFQHPVDRIGEITRRLDDFDIVVGVRTSVEDWELNRKMISTGMSVLSYLVLKLRGKHTTGDMMSGFFGIRTQVFNKMIKRDRDRFVGKGYKILLDILRLADKDTTIGEVYYGTFQKRVRNKSKLTRKQAVYTLQSTFK